MGQKKKNKSTVLSFRSFYFQCDENNQPLAITSTIYIPSQGKVACGRENGSIVIAPATQSIILQLLEVEEFKHKGKCVWCST